MGDYYPKSIQIGGTLKKKDLKKFFSAMRESYLKVDWAGPQADFKNAKELIAACNDKGHLVLMDEQAGMRFETFLEVCDELKLSYDVHRGPLYECNADGCSVRWIKGQRKPFRFDYFCDDGFCSVLVPGYHVETAIGLLTAGRPDMAVAKLRESLPEIPELPKFEVGK
jgi:hypothetical protein